MFGLSLIQQNQKHFLNSSLCVAPILCALPWKLQAHWSCFLWTNGAFYIYPKYFPNVFIFYSVTENTITLVPLVEGPVPCRKFILFATPLIFRILPCELRAPFLPQSPMETVLRVPFRPHQASCPDPSLPPSLMLQPLSPLPLDLPRHPPWSPPLLMFQCHRTLWGKPTRLVDKAHCDCGSSWLLRTLAVSLHHGLVHSSEWLCQTFPFNFHP